MSANEILYQLGVAVFAVTGVLAAARQNMDLLSFVVIGVVTAIGGGTIRDVVLNTPVFWLHETSFLIVASAAAVATFFFERYFRATYNALLYLDALATAVFTIIATEKTLKLGFSPGVAVLMGVITGIGGGILRDLLTGQPTVILRRELSMTPIIVGGALYVVARHVVGPSSPEVPVIAMAVIAAVRIAAIRWQWAFPVWLTYRPAK